MTGLAVQISSEFVRKSSGKGRRYGTKDALQQIVTRLWPQNTVNQLQRTFGLTEGQAKGVVYATASLSTIDTIKRHPNWTWDLSLELEALVLGHSLGEHIEKRRAHEREQYEKMDRGLREMAAGVSSVLRLGSLRDH